MQPLTLISGLLAVSLPTLSLANEANVTIACESIAVYSAEASDTLGTTYTISSTADFDELGNVGSINNEWFAFDGTVGYATLIQLEEDLFGSALFGFLDTVIPLPGDDNFNFIADFFEVNRPISAQTAGSIDFGDGPRDVTVNWQRNAGEAQGRLGVTFKILPLLGGLEEEDLTFDQPFEIFQYQGKMTYTSASAVGGAIAASVDLNRVGGEGRFTGPMPMVLTDSRTLERQPTQWVTPDTTLFDVLGTFEIDGVPLPLDRISNRPWYGGTFFFLDGIPSTPDFQDEFDLYNMFVEDLNDSDGDGIPDLTDIAGVVPTEPPVLAISSTGDSLQFTITGKVGTTVNIEQRGSVDSGTWTLVQTITLASPSETVVVNTPAANTFYRANIP